MVLEENGEDFDFDFEVNEDEPQAVLTVLRLHLSLYNVAAHYIVAISPKIN